MWYFLAAFPISMGYRFYDNYIKYNYVTLCDFNFQKMKELAKEYCAKNSQNVFLQKIPQLVFKHR